MVLTDPVLSVFELGYRYASEGKSAKSALNDVTFTVEKARGLALMGPNGAGKSTLISCVCGRLRPSAGSVSVLGQSPRRKSKTRSALALVPQTIALFPSLSVRQNLTIFGRLRGLRRRELALQAEKVLDNIGLSHRSGDPVSALSGGMQRAVNLGVALMGSPKLLILDEPTAGIDVDGRRALHGLINTLKAEGLAILFTTHDMEEASAIADDLAILKQGELLAHGQVSSLASSLFETQKLVTLKIGGDELTMHSATKLHELGLSQHDVDPFFWQGLVEWDKNSLQKIHRHARIVDELTIQAPGLEDILRGHDASGAEGHIANAHMAKSGAPS